MTATTTGTTAGAREHARAQEADAVGTVATMPTRPARSFPTPPSEVDPATLVHAEVAAIVTRAPPTLQLAALACARPKLCPSSWVMTCTLSVDHRVVDGALGARWLREFKRIVEDPLSLLL